MDFNKTFELETLYELKCKGFTIQGNTASKGNIELICKGMLVQYKTKRNNIPLSLSVLAVEKGWFDALMEGINQLNA